MTASSVGNHMTEKSKILWVDDEVELLRSHILFLETKGYDVTSVNNGTDAVESVRGERYDLVLLDEQMPGMDGIETLERIKQTAPEVPVVMVTKSEEEHMMEEALGGQISDYLTKPVNPSQILLTIKRLLERSQLRTAKISRDYLQAFSQITHSLMNPLNHAEWVDLYRKLVHYALELEGDEGARQILADQYREANRTFGRFIEDRYPEWIGHVDGPPDENRPVLSHEVISRYVLPHVARRKPVILLVIDCMRYDQWLVFERLLYPLFDIEKDFHYSILPTATPYARNAIFSGLLPRDIARCYPDVQESHEGNEHSLNRHEERFLRDQLKRRGLEPKVRYEKLIGTKDGRNFARRAAEFARQDLGAVVVNFVDILAHSRSDSAVLREIAPDERAYRALTQTWFEHSWLLQAFHEFANMDATLVVTADHGAVRSLHATEVHGDRTTSTALRYKYGRRLKCNEKHAIFVRHPETYGLPRQGSHTNYIIAKEDFYFVYPTNFHRYQNLYRDTMQHGGASLEEMILPVATMRPRGR